MNRPLALVLLLLASPVFAEPIVGRAFVIDGDTLEIRRQRFRLQGSKRARRAARWQRPYSLQSGYGRLRYDSDGNGTAFSAEKFAVLLNKPADLDHTDFLVEP